ncbi:hypothetical protein HBH98_188790 [Parastagonospora nodorum]|nr:hypothetical protein HBH53_181540 [Parastagonospora nodorum]KAH3964558.1 hypothetical protein HBH51_157640 [Parastagonospora nodorum]KAH4093426.1 hypothetical protein HBH46_179880 [Parastagonospora nodorum]KAH4159801.1 hypothetical protein HBH43_184550 [Parastagonospora nodorum]KAH4187838.1 hypothetical protein HBH42_150910 [Parastagonospora nodorum]
MGSDLVPECPARDLRQKACVVWGKVTYTTFSWDGIVGAKLILRVCVGGHMLPTNLPPVVCIAPDVAQSQERNVVLNRRCRASYFIFSSKQNPLCNDNSSSQLVSQNPATAKGPVAVGCRLVQRLSNETPLTCYQGLPDMANEAASTHR